MEGADGTGKAASSSISVGRRIVVVVTNWWPPALRLHHTGQPDSPESQM